MMMNKKESRTLLFEVRADNNDQYGNFITGRPIVFGQRTNLGFCDEIIDKGALDRTDLKDVRLLVGHDTSGIPVARSRNNNANSTMQLMVVEDGMDMRANLDTENNVQSRALYSAANRGDISGMSFLFVVDKDRWEDLDSDHPTRHVMSIRKIFEVSAVAFPAYEQTTLEARSEGYALDSARASLDSARAKLAEQRAAERDAERRTAALAILKGEKA